MTTTTARVAGMTCGHCVAAVTEEVSAIAGVTAVQVRLDPGSISDLVVESEGSIAESDLSAAVDEAGYTLVGS